MRYSEFQAEVLRRLDRIDRHMVRLGITIIEGEKVMSKQMDDLEQMVSDEETVIGGAVTLLGALKTELDEALASGDLPRIEALSAKIGQDRDALAAAVAANTPAEPPAS